ncbi:MAG: glycosyltransferase family 2 protein [candidate division WOR-3 bacterium]|nr:glycosyltransferase family 2 protein [candidate division WOR-3 bacterium]MCX7947847.1 glycosyltransferase family 2 protein [candidate division WOR-3 bacterium]MDW8150669.1 glycosyltransferase family 2 protein [candidate division WOR-3 bacterium]
MKFSLICATYKRDKELEIFLNSLKHQIYKNFELIMVDQNEDDRVYNIVKNFENEFLIKYFRVNFTGLSKARNYGIKYIEGDILAFPDDDCEYPSNLLYKVKEFFETKNYDILSIYLVDKEKQKETTTRWLKKSSQINSLNILRTITSLGIFIKLSNVKDSIFFDEEFGVGAKYPAEDVDFVYRLIKSGLKGYFSRELFVYHPIVENKPLDRFYYYGTGIGAFLRKHIRNDILLIFPALENLIIRPIGGIVVNFLKFNKFGILKNYYSLIGRWKGFLEYGKNSRHSK